MGGAEAAVSSTVGYAPSLRKADHYWREGDAKEALLQQALNAKLCSFFAEYEEQGINVQKGLMKLVGFDVGPSRLPKTDLSADQGGKLVAELNALGLLDA